MTKKYVHLMLLTLEIDGCGRFSNRAGNSFEEAVEATFCVEKARYDTGASILGSNIANLRTISG